MSKRDMEEKSGIARPQEGEYAMLKLNREEKEKFFELIYKLASCDGVLGENFHGNMIQQEIVPLQIGVNY